MKINLEKIVKSTGDVDIELLERVDYNDMLVCVAKTLIDYRTKFNYNQEYIAQKLNMSQVMISKIESGKYNLSIKLLVKIWNKLSTKDFDFAKVVLKNMLKKSQENYDIKYNFNVYSTIIKNDSDEIFKLFDKETEINEKVSNMVCIKQIYSNKGCYSSVI